MSVTIGNLVSYPVPITELTNVVRGDASLSKQYAIGKKWDGTDVVNGEEGYHNNSKYWSEQAASSATTADNARIVSVTESTSSEDGGENVITITYKDGTQKTFSVWNGSKGNTGTMEVGNVTTGAAGSQAQIVNVGTPTAGIFNFTIPKGDKGDKGDSGVVTPINAFFTMSVDSVTGNLYVDYADNGTVPSFYYDSSTGNLYYDTPNS